MRRSFSTAVLALLLLPLAARAATHNVIVRNFEFSPAVVDIQVGDTVVWTNVDGVHNVASDDGTSFANGVGTGWTFSHTFNLGGSYPYHCDVHPGMNGTVNVAGGGGGERGVLKLEFPNYDVAEGSAVAVRVLRVGGDDAPVSVTVTVSAGTASASDFTAATGTLTWNDNDDSPQALSVATLEDSIVEGNETIKVTLSNATNGATIDNAGKSATITIEDDDAGSPCVPTSTALCLNNGRFRVEVAWRTSEQSGNATAVPLPSAPDSGLFYFFGPDNIEMLVKVLNACVPALGNKYWVFFAATTNVEFTMTVVDTKTSTTRTYFNPLGRPAPPIQDTSAFSTCP